MGSGPDYGNVIGQRVRYSMVPPLQTLVLEYRSPRHAWVKRLGTEEVA